MIHSDKPTKEKVINNDPIKHWIVQQKEYSLHFAAKNLLERPMLKGKPMCQRFHSKGYCFPDCLNKTTHIDSATLDESIKKLYSKYVDKCRLVK